MSLKKNGEYAGQHQNFSTSPSDVRVKNEQFDESDGVKIDDIDIKPNIEELDARANDEIVPPAKKRFLANTVSEGVIVLPKKNDVSSSTLHPILNSNIFNEPFVKDEFDLQESDSDEEGYSDIDLDEDEMIEDDDDADDDCYDPTWSDQPVKPRHIFAFATTQTNVGLDGRPKTTSTTFYFDKLLGGCEDFFKLCASGSNMLAHKLIRDRSNAGQAYFKEISWEEIQIFVGLCLEMSNMKFLHLEEYWNDQGHCGFKGFGEKMSFNRFQLILRTLNFEKLDTYRKEDSLPSPTQRSSVESLINFFNMRMDIIYTCGPRLILNEPLMFWKGNLGWIRDYSPKFRRNALKLHFLNDSSGLILKILLDIDTQERRGHTNNSRLLVQERISLALELLKEKLNQGHIVFTSKYYGSFALGHELAKLNTYCTGYVDSKRYGNCKQLVLIKLPEKNCVSTKYAESESLMMCKWRRRQKNVYFFSTDCLAIHKHEVKRGDDLRPKLIKELDWLLRPPNNIRDHITNYQISVDRHDTPWSSNMIIFIFNLLLYNAYILYTMHAQLGRGRVIQPHLKDITKLKSYPEFRRDVIQYLLATKPETTSQYNCQTAETSAAAFDDHGDVNDDNEETTDISGRSNLLNVEHMPMVLPRRKDKAMKKKCRICRKGGMITFSKLCCEQCPGMPGLCEAPCFQIWHDQLKKSVESGQDIKTRIFGTSCEKTIYL